MQGMEETIRRFLEPEHISTRAEVLARPCPVSDTGGVYGWWFRRPPTDIDTSGCHTRDGLTLLYVGISPKEAPAKGDQRSKATLRSRINTHYTGNAEGSTLRRTLGCLLSQELGIELRRVGSGSRFTFLEGEQRLSAWMAENALVAWVPCERPWEVEEELISVLDVPLNLDGNYRHPFHSVLTGIRSAAVRRAKELPVIENPGIGGRHAAHEAAPAPYAARLDGSPKTGHAPLGRLILTGSAATADRRSIDSSRAMLTAAIGALQDAGTSLGILVTPAGFVDHRPGGSWGGSTGWQTTQADFDDLAHVASGVAGNLVTSELREQAVGVVDHIVLGIDVWPTTHREPHAETACLYDVGAGTVRPITGKSYPTAGQQNHLIRNPATGTHVIEVGGERLAVLVCHDLAAWSPRGNAVARGTRAAVWRAMQAAVAEARPTLAVQLPHTVNKAATWHVPWAAFGHLAGGSLRAGTTAIRHLDQGYAAVREPAGASLLAGTGWGARVIDIVVDGPGGRARETRHRGPGDPSWRARRGPSSRTSPARASRRVSGASKRSGPTDTSSHRTSRAACTGTSAVAAALGSAVAARRRRRASTRRTRSGRTTCGRSATSSWVASGTTMRAPLPRA